MVINIKSQCFNIIISPETQYLQEYLQLLQKMSTLLIYFLTTTDWMFVSLPKFICWNSNSIVMALEGGASRRWLGHIMGFSALIKETPRALLPLPSCKDTVTRWAMNQEKGSHWTMNLPASWSWSSQPLELKEINFCCSSHPWYFCYNSTKRQWQSVPTIDDQKKYMENKWLILSDLEWS